MNYLQAKNGLWQIVSALAVAVFLFCIFFAQPVSAADKTWSGGGADNLMSTSGNWTGGLPSAGDRLIFDSGSKAATWDSAFPSSDSWQLYLNTGYTGTVSISSSTVTIASTTVVSGTLNVTTNSLKVTGTTTVAGGTVTSTSGGGTYDFDGAVRVNSGTYSAAMTNSVGGDFVQLGGTITINTSTITFDGSSDPQMVSTTASFYNLTMTESSDAVYLRPQGGGSMSTLTVTNNFVSNSGQLDLNSNNVKLTVTGSVTVSGGSIIFGGTNYFTIAGNLTISSGSLQNYSGVLTFNGSTTSTVTISEGGKTLGGVRASGNVSFTSTAAFTITSSTIDSGKYFELQASTPMTISGTGTTVITNNGTFIAASSSTSTFTGSTATTIPALSYGRLVVNQSGVTFTAGGNVSATTLTVASGTTLAAGTAVVTVSGDIANSGTITEASTGYISKANTSVLITDSGGTELNTISYVNGTTLYLRVVDEDENRSGTSADTMTVRVTTAIGDSENVTLTETGNATEIFSGSITIMNVSGPVPNNGKVEMNATGLATLQYTDTNTAGDTGTDTATLSGASVGSKALSGPKNPYLSINNKATTTGLRTVVLTLGAESATEMVVSEHAEFAGALWQAFTPTSTFVFSEKPGVKSVYARFANAAGYVSEVVSSSIDYALSGGAAPPASGGTAPPSAPAKLVPIDSDKDGLTDEDEIKIGTNKNDPDTDHDGFNDKMEIDNGYDPLGPGKLFSVDTYVGTLVKGLSSTTVYYVWIDKRRHTFPTEAIFKTWHADYRAVRTIPDQTLARIALGDNVRVRSGSRAIKLQSDPRVYFVGKVGVLHWVTSEALMQGYFGAGWNKKVLDLPDAYFPDYTVGTSITDVTQFTAFVQ